MGQLALWAAFLLVSSCSLVDAEDPTYTVVIPQLIRPGQDFDVCVNILTTSGADVTVVAKLVSTSDDSVLVSKTDSFSPGSQNSMTLAIPSTDLENEYLFTVDGSGGLSFSNETSVKVSFKSLVILMQTDKAIYQPGQTVMFRVMAVDPRLKPYSGHFDIDIIDNSGNKLMQVRNEEPDDRECKFVYGGEFPLADEPPLGDWKIKVKTDTDETEEKTFTVEEYVLPKVEVTVTGPSFFHHTMDTLEIVVEAKYTYGKPVTGEAEVEIYLERMKYNNDYKKVVFPLKIVDGQGKLTLNHGDLEGLYVCSHQWCQDRDLSSYEYNGQKLHINAAVTETITGEIFEGQGTVAMERQLLKLEFLPITAATYKEGLFWTGYVKVTRADGSGLINADRKDTDGNPVKLKVSFGYSGWNLDTKSPGESDSVTLFLDVPADGIVTVTNKMANGYTSVSVNAVYPDNGQEIKSGASEVSAYKNVDKFVSRDDKGIQVSVQNQDDVITSGQTVTYQVKTNEAITKFWYKILSKGKIVTQGQVDASGKTNTFDVMFDEDLAQKASPTARIIVWYITATGEVIVDSVELSVDGMFTNDVDLKFSKDVVEPGESVRVTVTAEPKSCVGVLAVDKSVLLLKGGNDITRDDVSTGMEAFDSNSDPKYPFPIWFDKKRKRRSFIWWPRYVSGTDASEVFDNAGVIILTDAYVHKEAPTDYFYPYPGMYYAYAEYDDGAARVDAEMDVVADADDSTESVEEATIREIFPETWLWSMFNVSGSDGEMVLNENAPDTITSWVATAFSISGKKGIGIMQSPAELTVFKSCFADLRLPYSAVRMEELELRVVVFNYENSKQKITVTLKKSSKFYARALNEISPTKSQQVVQEVMVAAGDGVEVNFDIKPIKLGDLPVEVHISSNLCSDALRKDLLTEAEGEPCDYSKAFFFALEDETKTEQVTISFPENVVEGSQRILITAIGDIMGSSAANLDNLIRQPSGCGEQNMLNFAPNIYVMDYFEATDTGSSEDRAKVKKFMLSGYQNELKFKRNDGSFSAFGQSDDFGSTWLTAFVLRCFKQAKEYIGVDTTVLSAGAQFILDHHNRDGSFNEPGRVIHSDMQGKAAKGIPLTAYIAKVLLEIREELDPSQQAKVDTALGQTKAYLEGQLADIKENGYSLALVCYFLCDVDSVKADMCLDYFEDLATKTGGSMYWDLGGTEVETGGWSSPYNRPRSNNVEVTAYGLLTFCLKGKTGKAAAVTKWLSSQRSSLGGYGSTQDTVIALQALSTFASKSGVGDGTQIDVDVAYGDETHQFNKIRKINADVLQMHDISDAGDLSEVTVNIEGSGTVLVQVNVFFNKKDSSGSNGYDLKVDSDESDGTVQIKACVRYNIEDHESGMVVLEIEMLTAYEPSIADLLSMYSGIGLRKVEYHGKTVAMYFDEWKGKEECVELSAKPSSKVNNLQAAQAQVYSYYANKERNSALYLPPSLMVSEVDGSSTEEDPEVRTVIGGAAGVTIASVSVLMPAVMAFILVLLFRI